MKYNIPIILLIVAIGLVLFVAAIAFLLFSNGQNSANTTPVEESLPTPTINQDDQIHESAEKESQPLESPNPTFTELLKTQPFWDMMPYYGQNFLVEYFQSGETIIITTVDPGDVPKRAELMNQYRQEARDWLTDNGAILNELTIEYRPEIN